jgi:DNA-directed RNA polymerase specialized sigma subunit
MSYHSLTDDDFGRLIESNLMAVKYANRFFGPGRRSCRKFRKLIANYAAETLTKEDRFLLPKIQAIPADDLRIILDAEQLKDAIAEGFKYLARRAARRVSSLFGCDFDDLHGESKIHLIWAIYGYKRYGIKFMTYAYRTMCTELTRYAIESYVGLTGRSSDLTNLKRRFAEVEMSLRQEGKAVTFHNVAEVLRCKDDRTKKKLMGAMVSIGLMSDPQADGTKSGQQDVMLFSTGLVQYQRERAITAARESVSWLKSMLTDPLEVRIFTAMQNGQSIESAAETCETNRYHVRRVLNKVRLLAERSQKVAA